MQQKVSHAERREIRHRRARQMADDYRAGKTLYEIGEQHGVTGERVRQLLKEIGVKYAESGRHVKSVAARLARKDEINRRCVKKNGLSRVEYDALRKSASSSGGTARRAFDEQRRNMRGRGYEWTLNFAEWWEAWQASGKWDQRGRGARYWLARKQNKGAYARGNVEVVAGPEFVSFVRESERATRDQAANRAAP